MDTKEGNNGRHLKTREQKKWQLALRRYVVEKNKSPLYAFYFGLSIEHFRKWIEIQFTDNLNWSNFGSAWQFDHIIPVGYFDFSNDAHLQLCWNFVNLRVQKLELGTGAGNKIAVIAAKAYFQSLYSSTGYSICLKIISRIREIEQESTVSEPQIESFIGANKAQLAITSTFTKEEFNNLNLGFSVEDILLEREIIRKFG